MANYFDYLSWRGDLSFEKDPLNEIDITSFAILVYLDYNNIVAEDEEITLAQAAERFMLLGQKIEPLGLIISADYTRLFNRYAHSTRFGRVKLKHYVGDIDDEEIGQFSAVVFETEKERVICFSGTDDTIVGWKESLNLMVEEIIPAQKKAIEYVTDYVKPDKVNYLVGHSKGGNLAMYSFMHVSKQTRDMIKHVYSLDGPGMMYEEWSGKDDCKRITEIMAQDSIIGRLFRHFGKIKVVSSVATGINQHDPFTWQIMGKHYVTARQSEQSREIQHAFDEILTSLSLDQRREFIRVFNDIMKMSKITTLTELEAQKGKLLKSYLSLKSPDRKLMYNVIKKFFSVKAIRNALWEGVKENQRKLAKK